MLDVRFLRVMRLLRLFRLMRIGQVADAFATTTRVLGRENAFSWRAASRRPPGAAPRRARGRG